MTSPRKKTDENSQDGAIKESEEKLLAVVGKMAPIKGLFTAPFIKKGEYWTIADYAKSWLTVGDGKKYNAIASQFNESFQALLVKHSAMESYCVAITGEPPSSNESSLTGFVDDNTDLLVDFLLKHSEIREFLYKELHSATYATLVKIHDDFNISSAGVMDSGFLLKHPVRVIAEQPPVYVDKLEMVEGLNRFIPSWTSNALLENKDDPTKISLMARNGNRFTVNASQYRQAALELRRAGRIQNSGRGGLEGAEEQANPCLQVEEFNKTVLAKTEHKENNVSQQTKSKIGVRTMSIARTTSIVSSPDKGKKSKEEKVVSVYAAAQPTNSATASLPPPVLSSPSSSAVPSSPFRGSSQLTEEQREFIAIGLPSLDPESGSPTATFSAKKPQTRKRHLRSNDGASAESEVKRPVVKANKTKHLTALEAWVGKTYSAEQWKNIYDTCLSDVKAENIPLFLSLLHRSVLVQQRLNKDIAIGEDLLVKLLEIAEKNRSIGLYYVEELSVIYEAVSLKSVTVMQRFSALFPDADVSLLTPSAARDDADTLLALSTISRNIARTVLPSPSASSVANTVVSALSSAASPSSTAAVLGAITSSQSLPPPTLSGEPETDIPPAKRIKTEPVVTSSSVSSATATVTSLWSAPSSSSSVSPVTPTAGTPSAFTPSSATPSAIR